MTGVITATEGAGLLKVQPEVLEAEAAAWAVAAEPVKDVAVKR